MIFGAFLVIQSLVMHIYRFMSCVTLGVTAFSAHGLTAFVTPTQPLQTSGVDYTFGNPGVNATYDYVIVGGGTAGLTIASRLAAEPSISVAVIEAGGFYEADVGNVSIVPGYCTLYAGTDPTNTNQLVDWGFVTTPQAESAFTNLFALEMEITHLGSLSGRQWPKSTLCSR